MSMTYSDLTTVNNNHDSDVKEGKKMKKITKKTVAIVGGIAAGVAAVGTTVAILVKNHNKAADEATIDSSYDPSNDPEYQDLGRLEEDEANNVDAYASKLVVSWRGERR